MTTIVAPTDIVPAPPVGGKNYQIRSVDNGPMAAYLDRSKFEQVFSIATMLSKSDLVPAHFKGKPENCFIAVQLASRMGMDPFAVMQACYIVSGKPGFEAKFVIALINSSGIFDGPLSYAFKGTPLKAGWTCTVSAVRKENGERVSLDFDYAVAEAEGWVSKGGSKWKTMPEQMMRYRAAAFFARVYCPEVIMGVQTQDELEDVGEPDVIERQPLKRPQAKQIESTATPNEPPPQNEAPNGCPLMMDVMEIVESLTKVKACRDVLYAGVGVKPSAGPGVVVSPVSLTVINAIKSFVEGVADEDKPSGVDGWTATVEQVKKDLAAQ